MNFKTLFCTAAIAASSLAMAGSATVETGVRGNGIKVADLKYGIHCGKTVFDLTKGFTVAMWIKPEVWAHNKNILNAVGTFKLRSRETDGFYFWNQPYRKSPANLLWAPKTVKIKNNEWRHLAFSYDQKGRAVAYVNGKKVDDQQLPAGKIVTVANHPGHNTLFCLGDVKNVITFDEVYIYTRVLTDEEVAALKDGKAPAGAAAAYLMDDPANPGKDSSGSGRDLTVPVIQK